MIARRAPRRHAARVRIAFRKLTDERHALEIATDDGRRERVECETRSYLQHDLLHYAVEAEAGLTEGFWGSLAAGQTLAALNDRTREPGADNPAMMDIERLVGAMTRAVRGTSARDVVAGLERYAAAMGESNPPWLDEAFVQRVQERMRRLLGRWRATPYGDVMELEWPAPR